MSLLSSSPVRFPIHGQETRSMEIIIDNQPRVSGIILEFSTFDQNRLYLLLISISSKGFFKDYNIDNRFSSR